MADTVGVSGSNNSAHGRGAGLLVRACEWTVARYAGDDGAHVLTGDEPGGACRGGSPSLTASTIISRRRTWRRAIAVALVIVAAILLATVMLGNHWAQDARDRALRALPVGPVPAVDAGGCLLAHEQAEVVGSW